jgi:AcrR family transcriptional regulator
VVGARPRVRSAVGMGRPAKFNEAAILDAALGLVAEGGAGAATVTGVAGFLGAPSGSIYHRFASRDLLMARLWIRTVTHFQLAFVEALAIADTDEAARAAMLHTPRWSRQNPEEAELLLRYRREDLVARWPNELGEQLEGLNLPVRDAVLCFISNRFGAITPELVTGVRFALIELPYSAVRLHLTRGELPSVAQDELIIVAGTAILNHLEAGVAP